MSTAQTGRRSAAIEGEFVVFIIGMQLAPTSRKRFARIVPSPDGTPRWRSRRGSWCGVPLRSANCLGLDGSGVRAGWAIDGDGACRAQ